MSRSSRVTQPTAAPTRKVTAATLAAAVATLATWALAEAGVDVPAGVEAALTTLVTFAGGYLVRDDSRDRAGG